MACPHQVLILAAREDDNHRKALANQLAVLTAMGKIEVMPPLAVGMNVEDDTRRQILAADIILLLLSPALVASSHNLLVSATQQRGRFVPVRLRECKPPAVLADCVMLPPEGKKAIADLRSPDKAWLSVVKEVERIASLPAQRSSGTSWTSGPVFVPPASSPRPTALHGNAEQEGKRVARTMSVTTAGPDSAPPRSKPSPLPRRVAAQIAQEIPKLPARPDAASPPRHDDSDPPVTLRTPPSSQRRSAAGATPAPPAPHVPPAVDVESTRSGAKIGTYPASTRTPAPSRRPPTRSKPKLGNGLVKMTATLVLAAATTAGTAIAQVRPEDAPRELPRSDRDPPESGEEDRARKKPPWVKLAPEAPHSASQSAPQGAGDTPPARLDLPAPDKPPKGKLCTRKTVPSKTHKAKNR